MLPGNAGRLTVSPQTARRWFDEGCAPDAVRRWLSAAGIAVPGRGTWSRRPEHGGRAAECGVRAAGGNAMAAPVEPSIAVAADGIIAA